MEILGTHRENTLATITQNPETLIPVSGDYTPQRSPEEGDEDRRGAPDRLPHGQAAPGDGEEGEERREDKQTPRHEPFHGPFF